MIHSYLLIAISVIFTVMMLVLLGQKLKIAYPIFLVIAGLIISMIPNMPHIKIDPDFIFLIFLPPILFEAAWFTSWKDFHHYKRQIFSLAFGLVFFTSIVIAYFSNYFIAGATLALGFLIGGINSPPDAVAATSVLKNLKIPKKITSILEGESLINDASSLIVFKFALAAIVTSNFVFQDAVEEFFKMAIGGIGIGLVIGLGSGYLLRWIPSNTNVDTVITILVPYFVYISAEYFDFSGVLAVVASGLMMSYNIRYLTHATRIQATNIWSVLIFLINAFIFILIGLELSTITANMPTHTLYHGIKYGVILSILLLTVRIVYCFFTAFAPWYLSKKRKIVEQKPNWKDSLVISMAGMRGVVSLAAALSIPTLIENGAPFPHRNFILFITFVTILITLVGQGLLLPLILKLLKYENNNSNLTLEKQEIEILTQLKQSSLSTIQQYMTDTDNPKDYIRYYHKKLENELTLWGHKKEWTTSTEVFMHNKKENKKITLLLIHQERKLLNQLKKDKKYDDELLRKIGRQLDYNEIQITGFE
ncbi:Na+/H+ antiporter [Sphingobacterium rhinopitheci]|uniref:Na+/H+ antiporter n=1 Tax=Sphingobacterium rhinopitheci TaxID=2781960 RepID=UPI001F516152|nr:Na+/H+ antiporter [Sphingobacterium rhinopitheci]MCI0920794.1 Na+/H+ antiporter [Sphingobacterium rhinopitheci]